MKITIVAFLLLFNCLGINAQAPETFRIELEEDTIPGMPGLQAFAYGQYDGKWLMIGGRTDGLHQRQPFASFASAGNNTIVYVVDPVLKQVWSGSLGSLPGGLEEQLQSTNMEFLQKDDLLYIIGGYGYSSTAADHITYPNLTVVNVPQVINSIIAGTSIAPYFRQITDQHLAVTGGYLGRLDTTFYLVCGQRFDGRYNPAGMATYTQSYTNEIRKFTVNDNGGTLSIQNYSAIQDTANLHRRDYNLLPQVFPNGEKGFTVFSGVFQYGQDLPWLNTVDIRPNGYIVRPGFEQYLNQYHSAKVAIWDSIANTMHSIFFGGISRYTLDTTTNTLLDDTNVPFVKTISLITRFSNDSMAEYKLPQEMPALIGSSAEFIPVYPADDEIIRLNHLPFSRTHIGTIAGGIESTLPNIFFINTGVESSASARVFNVYIVKDNTTGLGPITTSEEALQMTVYPNPAESEVTIDLKTKIRGNLSVRILDENGKELETIQNGSVQPGHYNYIWKSGYHPRGKYYCKIQSGAAVRTECIIINK
ncbi:MAG TPA: T9SS type A sorting domain-containing protein [Bacteroidia bacterium]|nr:T9SS type A sorting domain-containing protein [Bacteroidia bacterium]